MEYTKRYKGIESSIAGKTAIITGGTTGIGKACVELFCEVGANVVTIGRREALGKEIEESINACGMGKCRFYTCDVKDDKRLQEIVELTAQEFGHIDILINCAGYFAPQCLIDNVTREMWDDVINTNLTSYFMMSKFTLPYLRTSKGCILNVGSVLGTTASESCHAYCSTKGAIEALTKALAIDEARNGVRINTLKPGHIKTEIYLQALARKDDPETYEKYSDSLQWMSRGGTPDEVAYAAMFLCSDWASFITGTELLVSGGTEIGKGPKQPNRYLNLGLSEFK